MNYAGDGREGDMLHGFTNHFAERIRRNLQPSIRFAESEFKTKKQARNDRSAYYERARSWEQPLPTRKMRSIIASNAAKVCTGKVRLL